MYELALSQSEQASQLPILNLFEFCLDIGEHFRTLATKLKSQPICENCLAIFGTVACKLRWSIYRLKFNREMPRNRQN